MDNRISIISLGDTKEHAKALKKAIEDKAEKKSDPVIDALKAAEGRETPEYIHKPKHETAAQKKKRESNNQDWWIGRRAELIERMMGTK